MATEWWRLKTDDLRAEILQRGLKKLSMSGLRALRRHELLRILEKGGS